jgi:hypothetical protein
LAQPNADLIQDKVIHPPAPVVREDYDARGEAMAQSVQTGGLLSDLSTRPGALLSVAAIGFYLDDV